MREIPLTKGYVALVDDEDYEMLSQVNWCWTKGGYALAVADSARFRAAFPDYTAAARCVLMHRLIMRAPVGIEVDHRSRDGLDNQKANLRLATSGQNKHNSGARKGTSRFKGVCWDVSAGRWSAQIKKDWVKQALGYFDDEESAARAYDRAADKLHGDFAQLNFPDDPQRFLPMGPGLRPITALSGFFGVHVDRNKFSASVYKQGTTTCLGNFDTAYDAALYRDYFIEKNNLNVRMNF